MRQNVVRGSALLLTVMVVAVLTTMALTSAAVRYSQLASTDRINSAAVAKLAAESGVAELRSRLATGEDMPYAFDLTRSTSVEFDSVESFNPTPRNSIYSIEPEDVRLPRCLAVAVLSSWVNSGEYLFRQTGSNNPALMFHYLNIVNDTKIKDIPGNDSDDERLISSLSQLGHFYNPFAPNWLDSSQADYWLVNFGGPQDEFLSKKAVDGTSSLYKTLDLLYIPYLPAFKDSGAYKTNIEGTQFVNVSGQEIRAQFEAVIKNNNLKVWLDAAMSDDQLYAYGLGELFVESDEYRLRYLQPSLWNDLPEAGQWGPYTTGDIARSEPVWAKQNEPVLTGDPVPAGDWEAVIRRGAKTVAFSVGPFGFSNSNGFVPDSNVTVSVFGSLEGIRLNQLLNLRLMTEHGPFERLAGRTDDEGILYNARVAAINKTEDSFGVRYSLTLQLSNNDFDTPKMTDSSGRPIRYVTNNDIAWLALLSPAQFSTYSSVSGITLSYDEGENNASFGLTVCPRSLGPPAVLQTCPAIGDIVQFYNTNTPATAPIWGVVDGITASGLSMSGFSVDKFRQMPPPIRDYAHTSFTHNGTRKVAIFGGRIVINDYEGGLASETADLWFYTPSNNTWEYINAPGPGTPRARFGASMAYDSAYKRLVLFGGSYHEAVGSNCIEARHAECLAASRSNFRIARRLDNRLYLFDIDAGSWAKAKTVIPEAFNDPEARIESGVNYVVRSISSIEQRSGNSATFLNAKFNASQQSPVSLARAIESGDLRLAVEVAGFTPEDEVLLLGKHDDPSSTPFRGWARITRVFNYGDGRVDIRLIPYGFSAETVSLKELSIHHLSRPNRSVICMGSRGFAGVSCAIQQGAGGVAIGDMAVLEKYASDGTLQTVLWGYIVNNQGSLVLYHGSNYPNEPTNDYTGGLILSGDAVREPSPRWGAHLQFFNPSGTEPYLALWGGSPCYYQGCFSMAEAWRIKLPADPSEEISWEMYQLKSKSRPSSDARLQVVHYPDNPLLFLGDNGNPAIMPNGGSWDESATWQVKVPLAGNEAAMVSRLALGSQVLVERQAGNKIESFHGFIDGISRDPNNWLITLRHNPAYPGDSGLALSSDFAKLAVLYSEVDSREEISGINYQLSEGEDVISGSSEKLMKIPRGATVLIQLGNNGADLYHGVVSERNSIGQTVNLKFEGKTFKSTPLENAKTVGGLVRSGSSSYGALSLSGYQPVLGQNDDFTKGALEWILADLNSNPQDGLTWQVRLARKDTGSDDRPVPRQGAAFTAVEKDDFGGLGDKKSQLYLVGATFGRYGTVWLEDNAGKTGGLEAAWSQKTSPTLSGSDLPNMFGGALEVYEGDKAVFFGGKFRFDPFTGDRDTFYGARVPGVPQGANPDTDTVFTLAGSGISLDGGRALNGLFESLDGDSLQNSFGLFNRDLEDGACRYVGQSSCGGHHLRHLGTLGRLSSSHQTGKTAGYSLAILNPGSAYKRQNGEFSMMLSAPERSFANTTGRSALEGYYPYERAPDSDKTLMLSGVARLQDSEGRGQGTILVTPVGIGRGIVNDSNRDLRDPRGYSYCSNYNVEGNCDTSASGRYLSWLPDGEDVLAAMGIAAMLSGTDTYRVIGYYGGVTWALLVNTRGGLFNIEQTIP